MLDSELSVVQSTEEPCGATSSKQNQQSNEEISERCSSHEVTSSALSDQKSIKIEIINPTVVKTPDSDKPMF